MFDVNTSSHSFWKKVDIIKPKKIKGNRMFTPEDVKNFIIYHLVKSAVLPCRAKDKLKVDTGGFGEAKLWKPCSI